MSKTMNQTMRKTMREETQFRDNVTRILTEWVETAPSEEAKQLRVMQIMGRMIIRPNYFTVCAKTGEIVPVSE